MKIFFVFFLVLLGFMSCISHGRRGPIRCARVMDKFEQCKEDLKCKLDMTLQQELQKCL